MKEFRDNNNYPANYKYDPSFDLKQIRTDNNIPYLSIIDFENADWDKMHSEAKKLEDMYVHHRASESAGWQSLCIHGLSSVHTNHHPYYGFPDRASAPYRWTDIADWCPTITNFFQTMFDYDEYARIRIMKLCAGGFIAPHRDVEDINEAHIGPTNIALNNPENCKFYMENIGYLPFEQGSVLKLNLHYRHCVYNDSNEDRYHIIVHGKMGNSWNDRLIRSYQSQL